MAFFSRNTLIAGLALAASGSAGAAQGALRSACGGDLGFAPTTFPETGQGSFDGPYHAGQVPDGQGAWINDENMMQFYPEGDGPKLFFGSEAFCCAETNDDPGIHAGSEPDAGSLTNTADLEIAPIIPRAAGRC